MAKNKKLTTTLVAVTAAAALLLSGTFAWQSINQTALNEASDIVNPGGRLHNDMWYETVTTTNSDIYVENFADDEIFARVKLGEYMEIVMNQGVEGAEVVETIAGKKLLNDEEVTDKATDKVSGYVYEYATHYFHQENATDTYWDWNVGNEDSERPYFMPTFNKNKDSLAPDLNGLYRDRVGGISNREMAQYVDEAGNPLENYSGYAADSAAENKYAIYDGDTNNADEIGTDPIVLAGIIDSGAGADENAVKLVQEMHEVAQVGVSKGLISMAEWTEKFNNGEETADYWVYDEDGWVYWSSPIAGKSATGLLLDSFTLNQVMDDTWYYAIQVTGQFVTGNDMGSAEDQSGFYTPDENGVVSAPSENAMKMLEEIGVDVEGAGEDGGNQGTTETLPDINFSYGEASATVYRGTTYTFGYVATGGFQVYPNAAEITTEGAASYVNDDLLIMIDANEPNDTLTMAVTYPGDGSESYTEHVTLTVLDREGADTPIEYKQLELIDPTEYEEGNTYAPAISVGDRILLISSVSDVDLSSLTVSGSSDGSDFSELTQDSDYTYDAENKVLVFNDSAASSSIIKIADGTGNAIAYAKLSSVSGGADGDDEETSAVVSLQSGDEKSLMTGSDEKVVMEILDSDDNKASFDVTVSVTDAEGNELTEGKEYTYDEESGTLTFANVSGKDENVTVTVTNTEENFSATLNVTVNSLVATYSVANIHTQEGYPYNVWMNDDDSMEIAAYDANGERIVTADEDPTSPYAWAVLFESDGSLQALVLPGEIEVYIEETGKTIDYGGAKDGALYGFQALYNTRYDTSMYNHKYALVHLGLAGVKYQYSVTDLAAYNGIVEDTSALGCVVSEPIEVWNTGGSMHEFAGFRTVDDMDYLIVKAVDSNMYCATSIGEGYNYEGMSYVGVLNDSASIDELNLDDAVNMLVDCPHPSKVSIDCVTGGEYESWYNPETGEGYLRAGLTAEIQDSVEVLYVNDTSWSQGEALPTYRVDNANVSLGEVDKNNGRVEMDISQLSVGDSFKITITTPLNITYNVYVKIVADTTA